MALPFDAIFDNIHPSHISYHDHATAIKGIHDYRVAIRNPAFHVLIPTSESSAGLCKTLLSSFLLNYPPATLIDFGKTSIADGRDNVDSASKIKSVLDFLSNKRKVHDDDLVLVINSHDVWFQLPPEVLVTRYHGIIRIANERLKQQYGTITRQNLVRASRKERVPKFYQTILFAAAEPCRPGSMESSECSRSPSSTFWEDFHILGADNLVQTRKKRSQYPNAGTIIGPARDVRALYEQATDKVEEELSLMDHPFVFEKIFGEQEQQRSRLAQSHNTWRRHLFVWLDNVLGRSNVIPTQKSTNQTAQVGLEQRRDFGIGIDNESQLFQTIVPSNPGFDFLIYGNKSSRIPSHEGYQKIHAQVPSLSADVSNARPPFPGNDSTYDLATSTLIDLSPDLDELATNQTWQSLPLATKLDVPVIPALLQYDGDESLLKDWWTHMWFQPQGRALLRQYMRKPQPPIWGNIDGRERMWDRRGGRGGVWTENATWLGWEEVCRGYEEETFADGKGFWGREEGDGRVWNVWGQQIIGDIMDENGR